MHLPRPLMKLLTLTLLQHIAITSTVFKEEYCVQVGPEAQQKLASVIHHPSPRVEPQLAQSTWA